MNWERVATRIKRILSTMAIDFTIGGKVYQGVRTTMRRDDVNSDLGLVEGNYTFSLLCDRSQFDFDLAPRTTKITIGRDDYRLLSVDTDALTATVKLNLGSWLA